MNLFATYFGMAKGMVGHNDIRIVEARTETARRRRSWTPRRDP